MNWIDAFIVITVLGFGLAGLFRGLIKEVGSLIGVIGGIFLGFRLNPPLVKLMGKILPLNSSVLSVIAFALVFMAVVVVVFFLMNLLNKLVKSLLLGGVDKIFGFLFGAFKGLLLASILVIIISFFAFVDALEQTLLKSRLAEGTAAIAPFMYSKITGEDVGEDLDIKEKLGGILSDEESEEYSGEKSEEDTD